MWLTHDTFAPLVGTSFSTPTADGSALKLTLVSTHDTQIPGGRAHDGSTRTQFSLEFRGAADRPIEQGTYSLTHDELGTELIFLVPVRADADGRYYEAVFA